MSPVSIAPRFSLSLPLVALTLGIFSHELPLARRQVAQAGPVAVDNGANVVKDVYEAEALLRVNRLQHTAFDAPRFDEQEFRIYRNTQVALLQSPYIIRRALRKPGIASLPMLSDQPDKVAFIRRYVSVIVESDSELIRVQLHGRDPKQITNLLDAVMTAYMNEVSGSERSRLRIRLDSLRKRYKQLKPDAKHTPEIGHMLESLILQTELMLTSEPRVVLLHQPTITKGPATQTASGAR